MPVVYRVLSSNVILAEKQWMNPFILIIKYWTNFLTLCIAGKKCNHNHRLYDRRKNCVSSPFGLKLKIPSPPPGCAGLGPGRHCHRDHYHDCCHQIQSSRPDTKKKMAADLQSFLQVIINVFLFIILVHCWC